MLALTISLLVTVLAVCPTAQAQPLRVDKGSEVSALIYLRNTGWVSSDPNNAFLRSSGGSNLKQAIKDFQVFAGLEPSGELDDATVELMNTPRCGVPDVIGPGTIAKRKKRYALQGSKWPKGRLTYRIIKYPESERLSKSQVDVEIKRAFQLWEDHTNLIIERKDSGGVDIEISFAISEHGDENPFDGLGGTLAHAFFPEFGGEAHFDDQEVWTIAQVSGTNLFQTAAHEFGHALGLSHSDINDALMFPFYRGWIPNFRLHQDDIDAIQILYGEKQVGTPTTTTRRPIIGTEIDNSDLCRDSSFDTIFSTADGKFYVFKGDKYWLMTEDSVAPGYPRRISDDWPGLPGDIDAAVTWPDNRQTFFFKGSKYWKFENQEAKPGYPKDISSAFAGIPNNLEAAFVWSGNGKIYFFKNGGYWKFDPTKKPPVRSVYPRTLSNWDLPSNIRGAVQWSNKNTYFFTDSEYYRFDDGKFAVADAIPAFPRPTGPWWFGCNNGNDRKRTSLLRKAS